MFFDDSAHNGARSRTAPSESQHANDGRERPCALNAEGIRDFFSQCDAGEDGKRYLRFHLRRYEFLLQKLEETVRLLPEGDRARFRLLDVGTSFQTALIVHCYPQAEVNTLGFGDARFPNRSQGVHHELDLNQVVKAGAETDATLHDIVVMAEVIEHLYAPPVRVLQFVRRWLRPGGYLLLQTPNPVALGKRWAVVRGVNPFEVIREESRNPGHYCEYRAEDVRQVAGLAGFECVSIWERNYFGKPSLRSRVYDALCAVVPGRLHDGITALLRRPAK